MSYVLDLQYAVSYRWSIWTSRQSRTVFDIKLQIYRGHLYLDFLFFRGVTLAKLILTAVLNLTLIYCRHIVSLCHKECWSFYEFWFWINTCSDRGHCVLGHFVEKWHRHSDTCYTGFWISFVNIYHQYQLLGNVSFFIMFHCSVCMYITGCAVAQHCCKGDQPFQWEAAKLYA